MKRVPIGAGALVVLLLSSSWGRDWHLSRDTLRFSGGNKEPLLADSVGIVLTGNIPLFIDSVEFIWDCTIAYPYGSYSYRPHAASQESCRHSVSTSWLGNCLEGLLFCGSGCDGNCRSGLEVLSHDTLFISRFYVHLTPFDEQRADELQAMDSISLPLIFWGRNNRGSDTLVLRGPVNLTEVPHSVKHGFQKAKRSAADCRHIQGTDLAGKLARGNRKSPFSIILKLQKTKGMID